MLRDEGRAYAGRLREDGVDLEEVTYAGQPHGFVNFEFPAASRHSKRSGPGYGASSPKRTSADRPHGLCDVGSCDGTRRSWPACRHAVAVFSAQRSGTTQLVATADKGVRRVGPSKSGPDAVDMRVVLTLKSAPSPEPEAAPGGEGLGRPSIHEGRLRSLPLQVQHSEGPYGAVGEEHFARRCHRSVTFQQHRLVGCRPRSRGGRGVGVATAFSPGRGGRPVLGAGVRDGDADLLGRRGERPHGERARDHPDHDHGGLDHRGNRAPERRAGTASRRRSRPASTSRTPRVASTGGRSRSSSKTTSRIQ